MSKKSVRPGTVKRSSPAESVAFAGSWKMLLWALFLVNSIFFLKGCLDETHIPRFTFVAAAVLLGLLVLRQDFKVQHTERLEAFDLIFLAWLGINWASVGWAMNWAEAVLAAQKVFLTWMVFWLFKNALLCHAPLVRRTLGIATSLLTVIVCVVLIAQLYDGIQKVGLDNDALYDYAKGIYGNKGLAADFLFILLIFNFLLKKHLRPQRIFWLNIACIAVLILLLQTRTVYLATAVALAFYAVSRVAVSADFRVDFLKKIVPAVILGILVISIIFAWKGRGSSLAERLNPANYLESASANERRFVWYKTDLLNRDHPWLGVGNGNWKIFFPSKNIRGAYRLEEKSIVFTRAHNDYLEIRAEMGWVGASIFILIFVAAAVATLWGLLRLENTSDKRELAVLGAGLLGYCVIQFFDFPRERMEQQVMLAIMLAWTTFLSQPLWKRLPKWHLPGIFPWGWRAAVAGACFCLAIGWYRIRGERYTVEVLAAQARNDYDTMIQAAHAAENVFYQLSDVVLPMSWYAGVGYFQKNDIHAAIKQFARAYQQNPYSYQVLNNYAAALTRAKAYDKAIFFFEKALAINPRYTDGLFNLSFCHLEMGNFEQAENYINAIDTIVGAKTPDELQKNNIIREKKAQFLRQIERAKSQQVER